MRSLLSANSRAEGATEISRWRSAKRAATGVGKPVYPAPRRGAVEILIAVITGGSRSARPPANLLRTSGARPKESVR